MNIPLLSHPVIRFIVTGCAAAAVHYGVVWLLVESNVLSPLAANVVGWFSAFWVSFLGHLRWTFARERSPWQQALPRFFLLSAAGFAINQVAYTLALRYLPWRYDVLLALVLLAVAAVTFVASKLWAFRAAGQ